LKCGKTNTVIFKTNNLPHYPLIICYKEKFIKETTNIKFLGMRIDIHLKWKSHVGQMILKFSATCYPVRMIFHISNTDSLQMIYLAYFLPVIKYGKFFCRKGYLYYRKGNLELWLELDLEVHVEGYTGS
jgi:hypothetical protein